MTRDYFAEMYVAGLIADAGWNIYFPHRDEGFDFIISKKIGNRIVLRPVQVKGKYPELDKRDRPTYGYAGALTALHSEMVLAIPYFPTDHTSAAPDCVAYMPRSQIRPQQGRGWRCEPAKFENGIARPRRDFQRYFDREGLAFMEEIGWTWSQKYSVRPCYTVSDGKLVLNIETAEEGGCIVTSPLDPELITRAETLEKAFANARDAIHALNEARAKR